MRKICLLTCLFLSNTSYAQTAVAAGQPSPADGIFLTKKEAAKVIAEKKAAEEICKITIEENTQVLKTKCDYDKSILQNEVDYEKNKFIEISKLRDVQDKDLQQRIADSGDNLYYFLGGLAVGTVVVGAITVGAFVYVNQVYP
jgi:hypothetical protein